MNSIALDVLKIALPMIEKIALDEWSSKAMPFLQMMIDKAEAGKGKEEAQIMLEALDKIVKFEASRKIA